MPPCTRASAQFEAAPRVPEAASREAFRLLDDACLRGGSAAQLATQLEQCGALSDGGADNSVALYSQRVVDTLPKHWGGSGREAIPAQLEAKANSHAVLLDTLQQADALSRLPPAALRAVFEAGEKLRAVQAVRDVEAKTMAAARPNAPPATQLLDEAIRRAGALCTPQVAADVGQREPWEVFYACPSATASAFLAAAADLTAGVASSDGGQPAAGRLAELVVLSRAAQGALAAGQAQRQWHQGLAREAVNIAVAGVAGPDWLAQPPARAALLSIAQAALQLQEQLRDEAPNQAAEATALAADATDRALNAQAAALAAAEPADVAAAQAEYGGARSALLSALLREAERLFHAGEDLAGHSLLQRVESAAEAHAAFTQLFDIAQLLGDAARLHAHMAAFSGSVAPGWDQSLAGYVFDRLEREDRFSELLDLPERFNQDLASWLLLPAAAAQRAPLAWLHQLRMQEYSSAASTLARLPQGSAGEARRALALAKLSLLAAAGDALGEPPQATQAAVAEIDARLALLALQDALGLGAQPPLDAAALAAAALSEGRPQSDAQLALEVFAAAGPAFAASYGPMLEAAYEKVAAALQLPSREFL